jgi:hypothetical protein
MALTVFTRKVVITVQFILDKLYTCEIESNAALVSVYLLILE